MKILFRKGPTGHGRAYGLSHGEWAYEGSGCYS
jgi:hypothetical protein